MVEFTAVWCPNCQYNMKFAIDTPLPKPLVRKLIAARLRELGLAD